MKKLIIGTIVTLVIILGVITFMNNSAEADNLYDGNVTEKEAELMQEAWCEQNKGEDYAEKQCN